MAVLLHGTYEAALPDVFYPAERTKADSRERDGVQAALPRLHGDAQHFKGGAHAFMEQYVFGFPKCCSRILDFSARMNARGL